jgi:hypothetical protein
VISPFWLENQGAADRSIKMKSIAIVMVVCAAVLSGCGRRPSTELEVAADVATRRAKFVPQTLAADLSHLSESDRQALGHLVAAARIVDQIFTQQAWQGNPNFAPRVAEYSGSDAEAFRDLYRIMYGKWDRLEELEPFVGRDPHPEGAGYYPEDLTKQEFEAWLEANPEDGESFRSLHTVIPRDGDGLVAVPYSEAYQELLEQTAGELRAAAAATENDSLRRFLELRADALKTDDYFASDMAWMDLDSPIEVVIGPYETYEDRLFGYKAAFEAFVCVANPQDSERLAVFKGELPFLERNLPIPDRHKNLDRGTSSPIRVVDELFAAGDTRAGVQTIAFNLPNDERVREAKGSKKVLLKNIMRAKYDAILTPIAARVLPDDEAVRVDFEAFYQFILHHELAHGLGPGQIVVDGRDTEVRLELKQMYSTLEEAKADVLGVYNIYALVERGVMEPEILDHLPWTYTAGMFRTTRFGLTEAHGRGMVIQANFLLERGAVEITEDGRFRPVPERFEEGFRELARELLTIQATGDYRAAVALQERYGSVPEAMRAGIDRLAEIPVDVDPVFSLKGLS